MLSEIKKPVTIYWFLLNVLIDIKRVFNLSLDKLILILLSRAIQKMVQY